MLSNMSVQRCLLFNLSLQNVVEKEPHHIERTVMLMWQQSRVQLLETAHYSPLCRINIITLCQWLTITLISDFGFCPVPLDIPMLIALLLVNVNCLQISLEFKSLGTKTLPGGAADKQQISLGKRSGVKCWRQEMEALNVASLWVSIIPCSWVEREPYLHLTFTFVVWQLDGNSQHTKQMAGAIGARERFKRILPVGCQPMRLTEFTYW